MTMMTMTAAVKGRAGEKDSRTTQRSDATSASANRSGSRSKSIPRLSARHISAANLAQAGSAAQRDRQGEREGVPDVVIASPPPIVRSAVVRRKPSSSPSPLPQRAVNHGNNKVKSGAAAGEYESDFEGESEGDSKSDIFAGNAKAEELFSQTLDRVLSLHRRERETQQQESVKRREQQVQEELEKKRKEERAQRLSLGRARLEEAMKKTQTQAQGPTQTAAPVPSKVLSERAAKKREEDAQREKKRLYDEKVRRLNWRPASVNNKDKEKEKERERGRGRPITDFLSLDAPRGASPHRENSSNSTSNNIDGSSNNAGSINANNNSNNNNNGSAYTTSASESITPPQIKEKELSLQNAPSQPATDFPLRDYLTWHDGAHTKKDTNEGNPAQPFARSLSHTRAEKEKDFLREMSETVREMQMHTQREVWTHPETRSSQSDSDREPHTHTQSLFNTHSHVHSNSNHVPADTHTETHAENVDMAALIEVPQIRLSLSGRIKSALRESLSQTRTEPYTAPSQAAPSHAQPTLTTHTVPHAHSGPVKQPTSHTVHAHNNNDERDGVSHTIRPHSHTLSRTTPVHTNPRAQQQPSQRSVTPPSLTRTKRPEPRKSPKLRTKDPLPTFNKREKSRTKSRSISREKERERARDKEMERETEREKERFFRHTALSAFTPASDPREIALRNTVGVPLTQRDAHTLATHTKRAWATESDDEHDHKFLRKERDSRYDAVQTVLRAMRESERAKAKEKEKEKERERNRSTNSSPSPYHTSRAHTPTQLSRENVENYAGNLIRERGIDRETLSDVERETARNIERQWVPSAPSLLHSHAHPHTESISSTHMFEREPPSRVEDSTPVHPQTHAHAHAHNGLSPALRLRAQLDRELQRQDELFSSLLFLVTGSLN